MPTSSDYLRNKMIGWFGDITEAGPMAFLEGRGYVLHQSWEWTPPAVSHTVSREEEDCIIFLIQEWDFGGLRNWGGTSLYYEDAMREKRAVLS